MTPSVTRPPPRGAGLAPYADGIERPAGTRWRGILLRQIDARPHDVVVDVGCGGGELAVMLKLDSPAACVYGLDADPAHLNDAERRAYEDGATVHFAHAKLDDAGGKLAALTPQHVVCSNVLGQLPFHRRLGLVAAIYAALPRGGAFHVADAGWHSLADFFQRGSQAHLNSVRVGVLSLMRSAGFADCVETNVVPAGSGPIALFRGVKA